MPALDSVFVCGSRLKPFMFRLVHEDRSPIDLTGHTVTLTLIADADASIKLNAGPCTIINPLPDPTDRDDPHGYYAWTAADMVALTPGDYWAYVRRTSGGLYADLPEGPDGQNRGRGCKIKFVTAA